MANSGSRTAQVIVCGLATVDIVARPAPLDQAIGPGRLVNLDQVEATTGGIVSNSGIALCRLGISTAAIACVGQDEWAELIRRRYREEGLDPIGLAGQPTESTSTTIVLVAENGERSFLFCRGAATRLSSEQLQTHSGLFRDAEWALFGYFSLFPEFDRQLPAMLEFARRAGCKTALDCAGSGGESSSLRPILPLLDLYVPSHDEAIRQTGLSEPRAILGQYRAWGAKGVIGLKLGAQGALLSPSPEQFLEIAAIDPGRPVVDTTGAGDAFYAGLIAGLAKGKSLSVAGKIAAATGAACVTALGASAGLRTWEETCRLANVTT